MRALKNILVTGGAGFIGCNFIRFVLEKTGGFTGKIINLDALTAKMIKRIPSAFTV